VELTILGLTGTTSGELLNFDGEAKFTSKIIAHLIIETKK
jgi:hypothetical protein